MMGGKPCSLLDRECKAMGDQNGPRVQSNGRPKWTASAKQWETKMDHECKAVGDQNGPRVQSTVGDQNGPRGPSCAR